MFDRFAVETISGTLIHPIWSVDRNDWVPLGELAEGETLQASGGIATVLSLALVTCSLPVYNIEVHGEHVYQVGELGLLVHNSNIACNKLLGEAGEIVAGTAGPKTGLRSMLNPSRWRFPDKIDDVTKTIFETKNVAYQHLSTQLRDYVKIADNMGYQLVLNMRTNTKVSAKLQELIDVGKIIPNWVL